MDAFSHIALVRQQTVGLRNLAGFNKSRHRIPEQFDSRAETFVAKIAAENIRRELESVFSKLRKEFQFKRVEVEDCRIVDATGAIITPAFTYSISFAPDPSDPAQVLVRRETSDFRDAETVLSEPFDKTFHDYFDTVTLTPQNTVDLNNLIDHLEEVDDPRIQIDYDMRVTRCELMAEGAIGTMSVDAEKISVSRSAPDAPSQLLRGFLDFKALLNEIFNSPIAFR